jgi:hypothetical protein
MAGMATANLRLKKFHGTGGRVAVWVEASVNPNSLPVKKMAATAPNHRGEYERQRALQRAVLPPPLPLPSVLEELPWKHDHFIGVALYICW